jgi:protein SCO1/2
LNRGVRGVLAVLIVAAAACSAKPDALPFYRSAEMTPEWLGSSQAASPAMHRVAPFVFVDQSGASVNEHVLDGKVTIVQFFFTDCGDICPNTTRNIAGLLRAMPADVPVQVLSYSVRPERDSIAALRAFAARRGVTDPRWHLLTGPRAAMETLARASYFVSLGSGANYGVDSIAHTESLLLVDGDRRLRGVYAGMLELEVNKLADDVRELARVSGVNR